MSFTIYDNDIIMCSGDNLLTYDTSSEKIDAITLPKLIIDDNQKLHNNVDVDAYHGINSVFTSNKGDYFTVCTNRKQLCLYERTTRNLISNRKLVRAASRAIFTPENDVVVGDKSGDAYLYETKNPDKPGILLLGHLSMLLDVIVTSDNKYIISADRDEKIRVSSFPNAYNIVSYCLGHEKFVTAVGQLPGNERILVSAGGDGQLKFWDWAKSKELASHNFGEKISQLELERLNESLKGFELTESVETLPVKHLRTARLDSENAILAVTFYSTERILLYSVSKDLQLEFLEAIDAEEEPLECLLREWELWILNNRGLRVYNLKGKKFTADNARNERLERLNESWRTLRKNTNSQSLFPILYKRKFDNVQEYRERKKSRLGN